MPARIVSTPVIPAGFPRRWRDEPGLPYECGAVELSSDQCLVGIGGLHGPSALSSDRIDYPGGAVDVPMSGQSRRQGVAIGLACVAGLIGGLIVAFLLRPGNADVRSAAGSLVPPGAEVVKDIGDAGLPLAGDSYSVSIDYQGGAPDENALLSTVERLAAERSWRETAREQAPGATMITYRRDGIIAFVEVQRNRGRVAGGVDARRDGSTQGGPRVLAAVAGALVVGGGTAIVLRLRRPRQEG